MGNTAGNAAGNAPLTQRFDDAMVRAARWHRTQVRKADPPVSYLGHLLSVAGLVIEVGGSEDQAIAALLHDSIEDCGKTHEQIAAHYGTAVADIVLACTDAQVPQGQPKPEWRPRKEAYLAHLPDAPPDAWLVSLCDKLHNATCIARDVRTGGIGVLERFNGRRDGTLWYYRSLADLFARLLPGHPYVAELDSVVREIEAER